MRVMCLFLMLSGCMSTSETFHNKASLNNQEKLILYQNQDYVVDNKYLVPNA